MSDKQEPTLDNLEDFMCSEQLSKVDAIKFLKEHGVDTTAFFEAIEATVQQGYSKQLREIAEQQKAARAIAPETLAKIGSMTRQAMLSFFEDLTRGQFGQGYQSAALARCRNKSPSDFTDEELRTWIEDVQELLGEPHE